MKFLFLLPVFLAICFTLSYVSYTSGFIDGQITEAHKIGKQLERIK